jgi:hypothetical protein
MAHVEKDDGESNEVVTAATSLLIACPAGNLPGPGWTSFGFTLLLPVRALLSPLLSSPRPHRLAEATESLNIPATRVRARHRGDLHRPGLW